MNTALPVVLGDVSVVFADGQQHMLGGSFFESTVHLGVARGTDVAREEPFGPVAPTFRFRDEAEAARMANDTEFGLACYLYTRSLGRALRVSEALEYGMVRVNEGIITTEVAPFGGVKESGVGRERAIRASRTTLPPNKSASAAARAAAIEGTLCTLNE